jgi:hypothetical protein
LGATSSGVGHKGFVISLPQNKFTKIANYLQGRHGLNATLSGKIRYLPVNMQDFPFYWGVKIPRTYLLVDDVKDVGPLENSDSLDVTAAVTFGIGDSGYSGGVRYTYSHFNPSIPHDIDTCVNWIKEIYVEEMYRGKVLTDFDEQMSHFEGTIFPIKTLMDPHLSQDSFSRILKELKVGDIEKYKIIVRELVFEQKVNNFNITGDGNVVTIGNNNTVTTINQRFQGTGKEELGKAIALLRAEILNINLSANAKNRLVRTTENLEEEALDTQPDVEAIAEELKSVKQELERNGIQYDANKEWGQKLKEIAKGVAKFAPKILPLIAAFL